MALIRDGDIIHLDVTNRRLDVEISDGEIEQRRREWSPTEDQTQRGFRRLYIDHVLQADEGFDFDFLRGSSGAPLMLRRPY